jgi:RHS repeat-associated protein
MAWGVSSSAAEQWDAPRDLGDRALPVSPHEQVVERVSVVAGLSGEPAAVTNRYVELADNLNYWDEVSGNWRPSVPEVVIEGNGAAALRGHQKVRFANQVNGAGGAVRLWTADGAVFRSSVLGLQYFDAASGREAVIATVKPATGELLPPNQVLYRDAFEGLHADVLYTYRATGLEQDVILREAPPDPEDFGLLAEATQFEVLTEVFEAPAVTRTVRVLAAAEDAALQQAMAEPDFKDEALDFGAFRMGEGRAFSLDGQTKETGFPVGKTWYQPGDGRTVLVEAAEYLPLAPELLKLPAPDGVARRHRAAVAPAERRQRLLAALGGRPAPARGRQFPAGQWAAVTEPRPLLLARQPVAARPGFVFDFETFSAATATNFTFRAYTTYYLSGALTLTGTNSTFEAAAILKYAPTNNARLIVNTPVTWLGEPYRPVVLTARDDQTVGESITNAPLAGYYAHTALQLNAHQAGTNFHLANLRIRHARTAIALNYSNHHRLSHAQFYACEHGIEGASADLTVRNVLFSSVLNSFRGNPFTVRGAHVTALNAAWLNYLSYSTVTLTNSLLVAVTNTGYYTGTGNGVASSAAGTLQSVGAGDAYLAAGSTHRNAGTTNLEPALAAELKVRTTYPPLVNTNTYYTNLTLLPQAQRDTDLPDRGYHYDPIDHAIWRLRMLGQSVLSITNGTVVASFGSPGPTNDPSPAVIWLGDQASLCAEGTPQQPVVFSRYAAVQERSQAWGGVWPPGLGHVHIYPSTAGSVGVRFCEYHNFPNQGPTYFTYQLWDWFKCQSFLVRDSTLHGAFLWLGFSSSNWIPGVSLVNNVFVDSGAEFFGRVNLEIYNNLFLRGEWWFDIRNPDSSWVVRDNVFQSCNVVDWTAGNVTHSHNAYVALANWNNRLLPFQFSDVLITNPPPFVTVTNGYVGRWFHGNTALVNKGSRAATDAGLTDYATQPTQEKEGATAVDIGFHHPAGTVIASQAVYAGLNTNALGNWKGLFGMDGFNVINDLAQYPSGLSVTASGIYSHTWNPSTGDARALQRASGAGRIAACWFNGTYFDITITGNTSPRPRRLALYCLDWDNAGRAQTIQILNQTNGAVLSTQSVSAFQNGKHLVWDFTGNIIVRVTRTAGANAVLSGLFLSTPSPADGDVDGVPDYKENQAGNCFCESATPCQANLLPEVTLHSPADGTVTNSATIQLSATASDPDGVITSVAFYAGTNTTPLATVPTPTGTNYLHTWNGLPLGRTALYARAHDNRGGYRDSRIHIVERLTTNPPPWVTITSPAPNAVFGEHDEILIRAKAYDPNGLSEALFHAGTNFLGRDLTPEAAGGETNFVLSVRGLRPGTYPLRVRVSDAVAAPGTAHHTATNVTITVVPEQPVPMEGYWDAAFAPRIPLWLYRFAAIGIEHDGSLFFANIGASNSELFARRTPQCAWTISTYVDLGPRALEVDDSGVLLMLHDDLSGGSALTRVAGTSRASLSAPLFDYASASARVLAMKRINGQILVGGEFTALGTDTSVQYLARLNGTSWSTLGYPVNGAVRAIVQYGGQVVIGGDFSSLGGNPGATHLARLTASGWQTLGGAPNGRVRALWTDGSRLFAGGDFTMIAGNTNCNRVAVWDGREWSGIGWGVGEAVGIDPEDWGDPRPQSAVYAITGRGNELFLGGLFGKAYAPEGTVTARNVVKATWNPDRNAWGWSSLSGGIHGTGEAGDGDGVVYALAVDEHFGTPGYDLLVAGAFTHAGNVESWRAARWVVGPADCAEAGAPSITITEPSGIQTFTAPANVTLSATATASAASITAVEFFTNGVSAGSYTSSSGNSYSLTLSSLAAGFYHLSAVAKDSADRVSRSSTVSFLVRSAANPNAQPDTYTDLHQDQPPRLLPVLSNDTGSGTLRIVRVERLPHTQGFAWVGYGATNVVYQPRPGTHGTDVFGYAVTDGTGTNFALVSVTVRALPEVQINTPADGYSATWTSGMTVPVTGLATDWDATITSVRLYTNGVQWGSATSSPSFSFAWQPTGVGHYLLEAEATDSTGLSRRSLPVTVALRDGGAGPQATITSLVAGTNVHTSSFSTTDHPVIRDGLLDLHGRAYHPNTAHKVTWQARLHPADADVALEDFINVTPSPRNWQGYRTYNPPVNDINGLLGTLDLSGVSNAVYDLELNVRAGGQEASAWVRVAVESQLKIGRLTFAEQDAVLPVGGLPLTVIRAYDSGNPTAGDFGVGWTMQVNDLDVALDEERTDTLATAASDDDPYDASTLAFSRRSGGGHNVTLTLPDGRRTTFRFKFRPGSEQGYAEWVSAPGVTARLVMTDQNGSTAEGVNLIHIFQLGGNPSWQSGGRTPFEAFDIPGWNLTLLDGTVYEIRRPGVTPATPTYWYLDDGGVEREVTPRPGRPRVTRIVQRTGDHITIGNDGLRHYGSSGTVLTRTIHFERDAAGRVAAIRDPVEGASGRALVRYVYHEDTGNLLQVHRLLDRAAGTYATNRYHYDHPVHLHYITGIENARGIPVARNEYDAAGRLVAVVDAAGRTNRFEHDTANRREIAYDRTGVPTTFMYDARGNVTQRIDAYGRTNWFTYDDVGNLLTSTDALTNTTSRLYDTQGNVLSVTLPYPAGADPAKYTTSYTYDGFGNRRTTTLPTGAVLETVYHTDFGLPTTEKAGSTTVWSAIYSSTNALMQSETLPGFGTTMYGNFTAQGDPQTLTPPVGPALTSGYDANGQITSQSISSLAGTVVNSTIAHDALGREVSASYAAGAANMPSISYGHEADLDWGSVDGPTLGHLERGFDDQGRLAGWETASGATPGFAYDDNGRLLRETNSLGLVTSHGYDLVGRLVAVTNAATTARTLYQYDAAGRRVAVTNALDQRTLYAYHPDGSLKAMTNAANKVWQYATEVGGSCCGGAGGGSSTTTDPLNRQVIEIRSPFGLLTQVQRKSGAHVRTSSISYPPGIVSPDQDAEDYPYDITDEGGRVRALRYDSYGRLQTATDLTGSGGNTYTSEYDPTSGAWKRVKGPVVAIHGSGSISETLVEYSTFDVWDREKTVTYAGLGTPKTIFYESEKTTPTAGAAHLPYKITFPSGDRVEFDYETVKPTGRVKERRYYKSSTLEEKIQFTYRADDSIDLLEDKTTATTLTTDYLYDTAGRFNGITFPSQTLNGARLDYEFDALNRISKVKIKANNAGGAKQYVIGYEYNVTGSLQHVKVYDPNSPATVLYTTTYTYDDVGRVLSRTHSGTSPVTRYFYKVPQTGVAPDSWTDYTPDDFVTHIEHKRSGSFLTRLTYERANGGEPAKIWFNDAATGSWNAGETVTLGYPSGLRLGTEDWSTTSDVGYTYDAVGNRRTRAENGTTLTTSYNAGFRIHQVTGGASTETYGYDNGGNGTGISRGGTTWGMTWTAGGRLKTAARTGVNTTTYAYDPAGRRTAADRTGQTRRFLVGPTAGTDLEVIHAVTDGTTGPGAIKAFYVHAGDQPILRFTVNAATGALENPVYYLEDAQGSVVAQVTGGGTVTRFRYDGFGVARLPSGYTDPAATGAFPAGAGGDFRFHGHWLEADTGFYHMRARDYDPASGRFLSRDPVEGAATEPESYHPYAFANANPHFYSDPTGEFTVLELNFTMNGQFSEKTFRTAAASTFKQYLKRKIHEAVHEQLANAIQSMLPVDFTRLYNDFGSGIAGAEFGKAVTWAMCEIPELGDMVWRDPYVSLAGHPRSNGFDCDDNTAQGNCFPHPDFILGSKSPMTRGEKAFVIGDAKWQATTLNWYFKNPRRYRQWQAITGFARQHTYSKTTLFITFARGDKRRFEQVKRQMQKDHAAKGVIVVVIPMTNLNF